MKQIFKLVTLALGLMLGLNGCSKSEPVEQLPISENARPVKLFQVSSDAAAERIFSAHIEAAEQSQLAFRVHGTVSELLVNPGQTVKEGDLLAALDPTDFQLNLKEKQTRLDKARADYGRAQQLKNEHTLSQSRFDSTQAAFRLAEVAYENAQNQLDYTHLRAPFSGVIARNMVDPFQDITAKQPILLIQKIDQLEVIFQIPEQSMSQLRRNTQPPVAQVSFDGIQGRFKAVYKEHNTQPDPSTLAYQISYIMTRPSIANLLPGMTAAIHLKIPDYRRPQGLAVPAAAVFADAAGDTFIWKVTPEMTVNKSAVSVGQLSGEMINIIQGIDKGDKIVAAGVHFLQPGQKIQQLPRERGI
ncbi:efflux RND transporter periplasmic adaptor subunit [Pelagibaculum spongiae]|uniref:Uncharacterized protein n=1 Tax=Pelagibaculum spongiae TaxID=2080658 RepID=A0A2V1H0V6_9GAMM|nr:efflux RND transporter periplasmic adaptor subunit [Pelagibaculum spongiae]PVZ69652.1 hypothetical protein DC094_10135 [Pelagibaculum spongiae]